MEIQFPGGFYSSIVVLVLLFVSPLLILMLRRRGSSLRAPPGPVQLPILGHLHLVDRSQLHRSLWLLSKKHGPIMQLQLGLKPTLVVSSARMASEIFKSRDHIFSQRLPFIANKILAYNFLDVAFSPHNDDDWRELRKFLVREFLNLKTVQSFRPIREAEVGHMISSICSSLPSPQPIDLRDILITLTNNVACTAAFGRSYLEGSEHEKTKLLGAFVEAMHVIGRSFIEDFLPWMWWIDVASGLYTKLERSFKGMDEFYERVILEHLDPNRDKQEREDCVDLLLRAQKESHLTRDHIKGVMMNILFGSTDTSAAVMTWGMAELLRNPRAMKKCQEEVRKIVGKKGKVDEDDLTQLQYLKSVVKESLRLHPPAPLSIPRECSQQCKIDGYDILPGTALIVNTWAIGRDPEAWDNPHEFLPERFLNSSIDYKGKDFELLPFGTGRRGCIGIHFAASVIELALANLVYYFDWNLPAGISTENMDMSEVPGHITFPKSILLVPTRHDNETLHGLLSDSNV